MNNIDEIVRSVVDKMNSMTDITLKAAEKVSEAVIEEAERTGVKAVVSVVNKGANPVLVKCMDDSFIASYSISLDKAYTSVALKTSTAALKKLSGPGDSLYGVNTTNNGRIVIFGGGEPLSVDGHIMGGLGVSGGTEEEDAHLAAYGREFFSRNCS